MKPKVTEEKPYFFKLTIDRSLFKQLEELAEKTDYPSANQFAVAVLEDYSEVIAELMIEEKADQKAIRAKRRERLLGQLRNRD